MIVQVGPYPEPLGGISIYIRRMKQYLDSGKIANEVWDLSKRKKNIHNVIAVRFRYVPFKYLFRKDIELIHYNICGVNNKLYIGLFNLLLFKRRKKILTIHGDSRDLFNENRNILIVKALNSFDEIICVKPGDKKYILSKGVNRPIYEIPAFIFPAEDDKKNLPVYISDFISSKKFIICSNASSIQFYNNQDLYGIDMCIDLMKKLDKSGKAIGMICCLPNINDSEYFNKLQNIIKNAHIEHSFLFVNEQIELCQIIRKSHLFLRPTNTEGYAVSAAEAIYYKVPVIASDVCIRPEGTILFKSRDIHDLYKKTADVIENYKNSKEKLQNIKLQDNAEMLFKIYKKYLH